MDEIQQNKIVDSEKQCYTAEELERAWLEVNFADHSGLLPSHPLYTFPIYRYSIFTPII